MGHTPDIVYQLSLGDLGYFSSDEVLLSLGKGRRSRVCISYIAPFLAVVVLPNDDGDNVYVGYGSITHPIVPHPLVVESIAIKYGVILR